MLPKNKLIVSVQDASYQYAKASVRLRSPEKNEWTELPDGERPGLYELTDFAPGDYQLRVSGEKGLAPDERTITLQAGRNQVHASLAPAGTPYYVAADGEKVYFEPLPDHMLVEFPDDTAAKRARKILSETDVKLSRPPKNVEPSASGERFLLQLPDDRNAREQLLNRVSKRLLQLTPGGIRMTKPILRGKTILEGLTNEIILKCGGEVTRDRVNRLAEEFGLQIVREITYLGNGFLLTHGKYPDYDILDVAAALRKVRGVVYAEVNRVAPVVADAFTPNDFLYPELPHLQLINADEAWDTLDDIDVNLRAGSADITIAVFDPHGVAPAHPDLTGTLTDGTNKLVTSFNFASLQAQTVAGLGGDHGTQCASSATGRFHDASGGSGVAGNCHLIGARLAGSNLNQADAWMWAAGLPTGNTSPGWPAPVSRPADVITNSWGSNGAALPNIFRDAFDYLATYGRNGRGCIVCFSLGNNGYIDFTTHPTRRRMYAAYAKTIAVGASINVNPTSPVNSSQADPNGNFNNLTAVTDTRTFYSPFGPAIDVVAPSHTAYIAGGGIADPVLSTVRQSLGDVPATGVTVTALSSPATAGSTTLQVVSAAGVAAGDALVVNAPGASTRDYHRVTGVSGNQLSLNGTLNNAYASGTAVRIGAADYDFAFGGTSHACPTVAGTLALILSVNPLLNWVQAREILRETAVRIDFGQANATGQWVDNDGDGTNEYSQWYGYGRIDVDAAVTRARDLSDLGDIVIRDDLADNGSTPSAGWHAHSPDIWVRRSNDPIPSLAYTAAPPHQNAVRGQDNYVFLRVRNNGTAATNEVYLRALICHFPGFEFRYPQEWTPTTRPSDPIPNPLVPGTYLIGEQLIDNLAAGDDQIVKLTWPAALVPPETVSVAGVNVSWHPCLLAEASPHDGAAPASSGHAVKDNNNLAHRNIHVEDGTDADSIAVAAIAGTSDLHGVASIIVDRSALAAGHEVFIRTADPACMKEWIAQVARGTVRPTEALPGREDKPNVTGGEHCCTITLEDKTRMSFTDCEGNTMVLQAPRNSQIKVLKKVLDGDSKPKLRVDKYQGQEVIVFSGGSPAIELPCRLPSRQYSPLVLGVLRGQDRDQPGGQLKATQRKTNGELSAGYTIEV